MTKIPNLTQKDINILIVEDETLLAMGMKCVLNEFNYNVTGIETTGRNAIEHVKKNHPDLILMDINLKDSMNGIEAAKYIWQYYKVPIIFLTSYGDNKTIKEAMICEPYAYLLKPCRDEEIRATIETTLHKHNYFFKNKEIIGEDKNIQTFFLEDDFFFDKTKGILYKNDKPLKLTGNEVKLIQLLSDYPNEPVTFNRISTYIWREDAYDLAKLRTLIYRLKVKIGSNIIENVFELGYKLKIK
ncbi:MAG: response regulator [Arcobacter sp.]|uniref:response regulator n=1 Tax=Arcobacter sp. TaxID=1872629 RepID=UPI003C763F18